MTASSATGKGLGNSNKPTSKELAKAANGPVILAAGRVNAEENMSPPASSNIVRFPYPLPGDADDYVVILTTLNGGSAYVTDMFESNGHFTGFAVLPESESTVMYMVCKTGHKPN